MKFEISGKKLTEIELLGILEDSERSIKWKVEKIKGLSNDAMTELYAFIVETNNEFNLVRQCSSKKAAKELAEWFQVE